MDRKVDFKISGLYKAFDDHPVLCGIDLEITRGEFVAIVGGSGCGKTVLLNHILGLMTADAGQVLIADPDDPCGELVDIAALGEDEVDRIHTHWGVVFQKNALFSGTVFDNIALWLKEIKNFDDDVIKPIARKVLSSVALPTDDGFLSTDTQSLSGGMAKRLAVARALAMSPTAIFYDEPTTGLDPTSASQVQDLLLSSHRADMTTIVITHDKDLLARLHPRTIMLHEGKVLFDGLFKDFESSTSKVIRPYFDLMPVLNLRGNPY